MNKIFFAVLLLLLAACNSDTPPTLPDITAVSPTETSIPATETAVPPTETAVPPTATLPPATFPGTLVSQAGITFTLPPGIPTDLKITLPDNTNPFYHFSPDLTDKFCENSFCILIYPAKWYAQTVNQLLITDLRDTLMTQSTDYFPPAPGAILAQAQTRLIPFQNGNGIRAVSMLGVDLQLLNNAAIQYDFYGFTADYEYYVNISVPIDATILLDSADPAQNQNPAALLPPPLPTDNSQREELIRQYNWETAAQLDLLTSDQFTPDLASLDLLVLSLRVEPSG